jgi:hypothetical protein
MVPMMVYGGIERANATWKGDGLIGIVKITQIHQSY